jgi:hypothetical protein
MKKGLVVILVTLLGVSGFLYYDWHTKTRERASEPSIPQYSWTDAQGTRHFTDRPPPQGATNIKETQGYKSIDPPLVVSIKNKAVETYQNIKKKLFKPKKKKKRRAE